MSTTGKYIDGKVSGCLRTGKLEGFVVMIKGCWISFWGKKNALKLIMLMIAKL